MLHLRSAIEQLNHVMEYPSIRLSMFGDHLRRLEGYAVVKEEAGLIIALAKPFHRLLKYHLFFQDPLLYIDLVALKFGAGRKIVTEIETIFGGIEDEKIQKKDYHKVWDVLGRIDGLDKVARLAVPKPSRILLEECRTLVKSRRTSKGLGDVVQPEGSNGISERRDLWLLVFNDVVLRCQRTDTVSLPGWGASWKTGPKLENLYRFLKARFIARITLCYPTDELSRLRRGMLTSLFERIEWLHSHSSRVLRYRRGSCNSVAGAAGPASSTGRAGRLLHLGEQIRLSCINHFFQGHDGSLPPRKVCPGGLLQVPRHMTGSRPVMSNPARDSCLLNPLPRHGQHVPVTLR